MPVKKAIKIPSNAQLWKANDMDAKFPNFSSWTSKGTKDIFNEKGFEMLQQFPEAKDTFFELSVQFMFQYIDRLDVKDPFEQYDFGEAYDVPYGQILQRMNGENYRPINPAYADPDNLKDGKAPSPYIRRQPKLHQRFFRQNFNYQNTITIPDDFRYKVIFTDPYGMGNYITDVIMKGIQNSYVIQKYENKLEALNALLNSTAVPLTSTQKLTWDVADKNTPTDEELTHLFGLISETETMMTIGPTSSAFNALGYDSVQDKSRLRLLLRVPVITALNSIPKLNLPAGFSKDDKLNFDVPVVPVRNFGGLQPYKDAEFTTPLYPVYSEELGELIGYAETAGATTPTVAISDVKWKDPNENIIAILADKGVIFEGIQNPYRVAPQRNERMLETYMWASSPNNTVAADALYNLVTFSTSNAA